MDAFPRCPVCREPIENGCGGDCLPEPTGAQQGRLDLIALEHGQTSVTFDGPELDVLALDGTGAAYTVDVDGHAQLRRHRAEPLFAAPQTIRGQTAMQTDERPDR